MQRAFPADIAKAAGVSTSLVRKLADDWPNSDEKRLERLALDKQTRKGYPAS